MSIKIRTPESGGVQATQEGFVKTRVYAVNHGDDKFYREINHTTSDGRLNSFTVDPAPSFDTLTETYLEDRDGNAIEEWPKEKGTKYFPLADPIERPLEEHENYLTTWNYDLYAKDKDAEVPEWATTAKDKSNAKDIDYSWAKSVPMEGWAKIKKRIKPKIEIWHDSIPKVIRRTYSTDYAWITTALLALNRLITPAQVFVFTNLQWLVTNVTLSQDGIWYVAEIEYTGAKSWDPELYE